MITNLFFVLFREANMMANSRTTTRALPGVYSFEIIRDLIADSTSRWNQPAQELIEGVFKIVVRHNNALISKHFDKNEAGALRAAITFVTRIHPLF